MPSDTMTTTETTTSEAKFEYNEDRLFFGPSELEKCQEIASKITEGKDGKPVPAIVFDGGEKGWPEGAGAAILPLAKNTKVKVKDKSGKEEEITRREMTAILVWPVWQLDAVKAGTGGDAYLQELVLADQAANILNPLRRQEKAWLDGAFDVSSCPKTLTEHIEGAGGDRGIVKPYNELCKTFIPWLKDKFPAIFGSFTPQLLRSVLQSKATAKALMPQLEANGTFVKFIEKLKASAVEKNMNVELFDRWLTTRDADTVEIDFSKVSLDDLKM